MRFLVLAGLAMLPAMSAAAPPEAQPARPKAIEAIGPWRGDCQPTAAQQVAQRLQQDGHRPHMHLLNELPPASAYAAVLRQVNGCEAPVIIRYDIQESGGKAHK